jgi:hypothetical protein
MAMNSTRWAIGDQRIILRRLAHDHEVIRRRNGLRHRGLGWAGSRLVGAAWGFTQRMTRWWSNRKGTVAEGRCGQGVLQVGPWPVRSCESSLDRTTGRERQMRPRRRTDSAIDCAQSGSHLAASLISGRRRRRRPSREALRSENFGGLFDVIVEDAKLLSEDRGQIARRSFSDRGTTGSRGDFGPRFALLCGGLWCRLLFGWVFLRGRLLS